MKKIRQTLWCSRSFFWYVFSFFFFWYNFWYVFSINHSTWSHFL